MKIILSSTQDVLDFLALTARRGEPAQLDVANVVTVAPDCATSLAVPQTEEQTAEPAEPQAAEPQGQSDDTPAELDVELDADGRPWDEEIDASSKTKTAKGLWRRSARRDLTDERYNERRAELIAASQSGPTESAETDDEAVTTEVHALPTGQVETVAGAPAPALTDEYPWVEMLVQADAVLADQPSDMQALLVAARDFIGMYGTAAKDALLDAVVEGKAVPALRDPSDRRRVQAAMKLYGDFL